MRVLFAVHHPAHVHFFKHSIRDLEIAGHTVHVVGREKDVVVELLRQYDIEHEILVQSYDDMLGLAKRQVEYEFKVIRASIDFRPDVMVSIGSPAIGHAATILRVPHIMFTDNDVFSNRFATPFADIICTPENFETDYGDKHIRYPGYHELAYLHPDQFEPDGDLLRRRGIDPIDDYSVLRFISWGAHHDVGQKGLGPERKRELVSLLDRHGDVYITTEGPLPRDFEAYRLPVPAHAIHHLLYYANLYFGDSQTMATEAALLGTPAIRSNSFVGEGDMGNFIELEERYGLLYSIRDETEAIETAIELVQREGLQREWDAKRRHLLSEKVNVSDIVTNIILEHGTIRGNKEERESARIYGA